MGSVAGWENPFRPGAGARPPVLAGRQAELAMADRLLGSLERGRPSPRGLLFFGPRGNGKTVLLDGIAAEARNRGLRAESLSAGAFRSPRALRRELQEEAGLARARLRGATAAGFGISTEPASPTENIARLLGAWIGEGQAPLVILLDEAHTIEPLPGRLFFEALQEATRHSLPFLLLAAGTPDAPRRVRKAGTFTERALRHIPIGRISRSETLRALREPAADAGRPLRDDAAAFLADESQNYPYFIQLLGSAAWEAADDADADAISLDCARQGAQFVRTEEIERFYGDRFHEARDRGVHRTLAPLAELVTARGGQITDPELDDFLDTASGPNRAAELLNTLTDLGVLWQTRVARWEFGIPSFADFLLQHHRIRPGLP